MSTASTDCALIVSKMRAECGPHCKLTALLLLLILGVVLIRSIRLLRFGIRLLLALFILLGTDEIVEREQLLHVLVDVLIRREKNLDVVRRRLNHVSSLRVDDRCDCLQQQRNLLEMAAERRDVLLGSILDDHGRRDRAGIGNGGERGEGGGRDGGAGRRRGRISNHLNLLLRAVGMHDRLHLILSTKPRHLHTAARGTAGHSEAQ